MNNATKIQFRINAGCYNRHLDGLAELAISRCPVKALRHRYRFTMTRSVFAYCLSVGD